VEESDKMWAYVDNICAYLKREDAREKAKRRIKNAAEDPQAIARRTRSRWPMTGVDHLTTLPTEKLCQISSFLKGKDLLRLKRVNRRLREMVKSDPRLNLF
jgi:hypothetical protein